MTRAIAMALLLALCGSAQADELGCKYMQDCDHIYYVGFPSIPKGDPELERLGRFCAETWTSWNTINNTRNYPAQFESQCRGVEHRIYEIEGAKRKGNYIDDSRGE